MFLSNFIIFTCIISEKAIKKIGLQSNNKAEVGQQKPRDRKYNKVVPVSFIVFTISEVARSLVSEQPKQYGGEMWRSCFQGWRGMR